MHIFKHFFLIIVCFACIISCVSTAGKGALFVNLTDNSKFVLLPTEGIERSMDMAQFLSIELRQQSYFVNSWVKADENAIEMTLFNEMGTSLGELSYRNGAVHFSSSVIPKAAMKYIKPEYVIVDFQLCFYNPILLENSLKNIGLVLEIIDGSRRILSGNEVIIEINRNGKSVILINHLRGYTYTLEGDFHGF